MAMLTTRHLRFGAGCGLLGIKQKPPSPPQSLVATSISPASEGEGAERVEQTVAPTGQLPSPTTSTPATGL